METKLKTYLGDGIHADYDGYHIRLYTDNSFGANNKIALRLSTYAALVQFNKRIEQMIKKKTTKLTKNDKIGIMKTIVIKGCEDCPVVNRRDLFHLRWKCRLEEKENDGDPYTKIRCTEKDILITPDWCPLKKESILLKFIQ